MDRELQIIKGLKDEIDNIDDYGLKKDKERELIFLLTQRYPFLLPRNVWTDKLDENYDYSYCWFKNDIPQGWWKAWGLEYLEDLRSILAKYNYVDKFRFSQVKEKYGGLRAYNFGQPEEWDLHEHAWEYISSYTCCDCGKFPVPLKDNGWISPWCDSCDSSKNPHIIENSSRLQEYLILLTYTKDGVEVTNIDMKPYYKLIGWNFTKDDLISLEELQELRKKKKEEEIII